MNALYMWTSRKTTRANTVLRSRLYISVPHTNRQQCTQVCYMLVTMLALSASAPSLNPGNLATSWTSTGLDTSPSSICVCGPLLQWWPLYSVQAERSFLPVQYWVEQEGLWEWHLEFLWSEPRQGCSWWCWGSVKKTGRSACESRAWHPWCHHTLPSATDHWHHSEALLCGNREYCGCIP